MANDKISREAHLEARELLLRLAGELVENQQADDTARVFAGAVKAYLEAELLEACLHLHEGKPVGDCPSVSHKTDADRARARYGSS